MSITCEYSYKRWRSIVSLLKTAKTSKGRNCSGLKGNKKRQTINIILIVCNTGNNTGSIAYAIKSIEKNCNQNKGKDTVRVTLSDSIYYLINQLSRLFQNHTNNSLPPR